MSKNIGLFGSSFNPPHLGHVAVLRDLTGLDSFDQIWVVPVFAHPYAKSNNKDLTPFEQRVAMVELVLEEINHPKLKISTIERDAKLVPSYSFEMVKALKKIFPDYRFTLILGSDAKKDLPRWHRYEELKKLVDFYFVPRAGLEKSPYPAVSSTEIRERVARGGSLSGLVLPVVADYIGRMGIYK